MKTMKTMTMKTMKTMRTMKTMKTMTFGFFLALVHVFHHAAAVEVYEGAESVMLSCPVQLSEFTNLSVVWLREELRSSTVHYKEQGIDRFDKQNQHYRGRTTVSEPLLGNQLASLTLNKPRVNDSATYTCIIRRMGKELNRTEVQLLVKEPSQQTSSFLLGVVIGGLCGFLIEKFVGFFCGMNAAVPSVCQLKEGARSLKLPYQTHVRLPEDATVEWTLSDPHPRVVHLYEDGCDQPERQHEVYSERTKMTLTPLQTGDLSLTLIDPCSVDSGIYVCTVRCDGDILAQKVVEIQVQATGCRKMRTMRKGVGKKAEDTVTESHFLKKTPTNDT